MNAEPSTHSVKLIQRMERLLLSCPKMPLLDSRSTTLEFLTENGILRFDENACIGQYILRLACCGAPRGLEPTYSPDATQDS